MTNKQLKEKIEEIVEKGFRWGKGSESTENLIAVEFLSLCKEYALSMLPEEMNNLDKVVKVDVPKAWVVGHNQAIKQAKDNIK